MNHNKWGYGDREGCQGPQDYETTEDVCGRPLGLGFNRRTGDLYIADAYRGLYVVGPKGGLATLVTAEAEGVPFTFLNGLDVDHRTGDVYFTDSSSVYQRRYILCTHVCICIRSLLTLNRPNLSVMSGINFVQQKGPVLAHLDISENIYSLLRHISLPIYIENIIMDN